MDYLWARRPILALTPSGTSANIVAACGGMLASPETPETIAAGLGDMIQRLRTGTIGAPTEEVVERYDVRRIAEVFDPVVKGLLYARKRESDGDRENRHCSVAMCGIAGLIDTSVAPDRSAIRRRAQAMADALAHRGPDGADVWSDPEVAVTLVHRRLAIIDLTPTGAQPMLSSDGRWVISYNGEVYNAEAIAADPQMAGLIRRGTSDTEVIVESVARRGLDRTLVDLNGMFAIALWDRATRTLHLVRDRLGIKPLFYGHTGAGFCFASELKSFAAAGFAFEIEPASVASFLRFGYVPAPHSIYRDVAKVRPGEVVSVASRR